MFYEIFNLPSETLQINDHRESFVLIGSVCRLEIIPQRLELPTAIESSPLAEPANITEFI